MADDFAVNLDENGDEQVSETERRVLDGIGNTKRIRVVQVIQWISEGMTSRQIIDSSNAVWGVSERTAHRYMRVAREVMSQSIRDTMDGMAAMFNYEHDRLYRKALDNDDLKVALDVLKDWQRLAGAYPGTNGQAEGGIADSIADSTPEQRESLFEEIRQRALARAKEAANAKDVEPSELN